MRERELNGLLIASFPELEEEFREYTSWQNGPDTGCFLVFEDLLLPRIRHALGEGDDAFLKKTGEFLEGILTSGDPYAVNVATVGVLEGLKADGQASVRRYLGPQSLAAFDSLKY